MKEQATAKKMQSLESNTSLSQNLDGGTGSYLGSNEADDYTCVNSDEDAKASHFTHVLSKLGNLKAFTDTL